MKEIVSLHIGQAGVQMGNAIWELLCAEHGINEEGILMETPREIECFDTFFSLSHTNRYIPRSIFVDLEASVVDEVKRGSYKNLFHPDRLITGPEDASSNFARGFFTVGKLLLGVVSHEIKRLLESADNTQAILIYRSLGGGTGSGLTSAIFDSLADFPKLVKIEVPIYPSPTLSTATVEPYNCLLSEHFCMEDLDVGLLLDNEALYDVSCKYLSLGHPTYTTVNRLVAQLISSVTATVRFESVVNCDITVLQTNLVPYPRIHFPLANFAPVLSASKADHEEMSVVDLTRAVFEKENQMMKVDHSFGRFMSCSLLFRGQVSPYHVYLALHAVKRDKGIDFVDWCPTGFKVGVTAAVPTVVPASGLAPTSKNVMMLANTSAIGQAWQRLTHKFYLLYSKRSFVHWFVGEGMEECEFTEALYNISALVKDYEEVTVEKGAGGGLGDEETGTDLGAGGSPNDHNVDQTNTAFTDTTNRMAGPTEGGHAGKGGGQVDDDSYKENLGQAGAHEDSGTHLHHQDEDRDGQTDDDDDQVDQDDDDQEDNQNCCLVSTTACGAASRRSLECATGNDNTLDNVRTSIAEDDLALSKKMFSGLA